MRQIIFLFFFFKCRGITPTALHIDIVAYKITEFYNDIVVEDFVLYVDNLLYFGVHPENNHCA